MMNGIMKVLFSIIKARRFWIKGGWHPPDEDPLQKVEK
jgi:hypothetical protein